MGENSSKSSMAVGGQRLSPGIENPWCTLFNVLHFVILMDEQKWTGCWLHCSYFSFSLGNCKWHKTIPFADYFNSRQWGALICHFHQLASKLLSVALTFFCLSPQEAEALLRQGLHLYWFQYSEYSFVDCFPLKNTLFFSFSLSLWDALIFFTSFVSSRLTHSPRYSRCNVPQGIGVILNFASLRHWDAGECFNLFPECYL